MIIVRSPLRITLGGGGTDVLSYSRLHGGLSLVAAIDKYVYITLHRTFVSDLILKYSSLERVSDASQVAHPLIREALNLLAETGHFLEIASMADIPAGTGLGSSSSFTTALLKALHVYRRSDFRLTPATLAEQACQIEIERLREPIGKQDQYAAAYGGLNALTFLVDGNVQVQPLRLDSQTLYNLEDHLLLFFTGYSRAASSILSDQDRRTTGGDPAMIDNLHVIKSLAQLSQAALESGDLIGFARLMHEHWLAKRARSDGMSNPAIDDCYDVARKNGALGGKLIGAGGGGFLMFYAEDTRRLRRAMSDCGLTEVRFRFDFEGTKVIINEQ